MKTFKYQWRHKTTWQPDTWKNETIEANSINHAKKLLWDEYYVPKPIPGDNFGGCSYSDILINFDTIEQN